jgi:hypothetical protein
VGCGKTTLGVALAENKTRYRFVKFPVGGDQNQWIENAVNAISDMQTVPSGETLLGDFEGALQLAHDSKLTIIFDEAHNLFSHPELCQMLFKPGVTAAGVVMPKILLLSAASQGKTSDRRIIVTPSTITKKFMWNPKIPVADVDMARLKRELALAAVCLDEDSIRFFIQFSSHHRGIFMCCMQWVQSQQVGKSMCWTLSESVAHVRKTFGWGTKEGICSFLEKCRGIKVKGDYSEISNIPQEFVKILCGGSKLIEDPDVRRHLCISGLVVPRKEESSQTEEFVAYDWNSHTPYAVANPLMVGYYQSLFKKEMHLQTTLVVPPASVIDFLLTALPSLSFAVVAGLPIVDTKNGQKIIPTTALSTSIPHEVQYSQAFNNVLKYNYEFDAISIEQPNVGNIDCYIQHAKISYAVEWILASATQNSHNTHLARFELKPAYSGANHKCLVTIGTDTNEVKSRVKETDSKTSGVTIVGLVSASDHTTYDIYFKKAGQSNISGPYLVECNSVALRLHEETTQGKTSVTLVPNQRLGTIDRRGVWIASAGPLWVKYGTAVFKVSPATNDVDSLKEAVKAKWDASNPGNVLNIFTLTVKNCSGTVLEVDSLLQSNTKDTAYIVEQVATYIPRLPTL